MEILLAAPTGRAAKRMTEATGMEAKTIHRLLEITGVPDDKNASGMHFERNEENPLEADVVIIDEMSMVDIYLLHSLLKAVSPGTRLVLVGDVNQLPSVGPGNVLRDIIESGCFHVVKLTKIFRQASQSDIVVNAHRINAGERIDLAKRSRDFLFIRRDHPDAIISAMLTLVQKKLPGYVNAHPFDIQIMTPMRKGALGVDRLNGILQEYLNPADGKKAEKESGGVTYREGDKVMHRLGDEKPVRHSRGERPGGVQRGPGGDPGDQPFCGDADGGVRRGPHGGVQLQAAGGAGAGLRHHHPQIPGKRVSGGGDPRAQRAEDADDQKLDLHGRHPGQVLRLPGGGAGGVPGHGGQRAGAEEVFRAEEPDPGAGGSVTDFACESMRGGFPDT